MHERLLEKAGYYFLAVNDEGDYVTIWPTFASEEPIITTSDEELADLVGQAEEETLRCGAELYDAKILRPEEEYTWNIEW